MKKLNVIYMLLFAIFILVGCGGGDEKVATSESEQTAAENETPSGDMNSSEGENNNSGTDSTSSQSVPTSSEDGSTSADMSAPTSTMPSEGKKKLYTEYEDVKVVLDWFPNTNHTGLYVAMDEHYFHDEGLEVSIIQPGENTTADQLVASGEVPFGISYQESVTQARAQGIPLVSIAAVIQHNTSAFASLKEANIKSVIDFEGKRYGGWGSPVEEAVIKAVMENMGADYSKVKNVTLGASDFFKSIGRDADFQWIYYGWDGVEAKRKGMEIDTIMLKNLDPALDYYTPVIVTSEKLIKENPELVKRFLSATAKGYEFAIATPDKAGEILAKNAPELNKELVMASQKWLADQYQADATQWGLQKEEVWQRYAQWMADRTLIPAMIDSKAAFSNDFLPPKN